MQELIAKANQVILESQVLRRERRALRVEASALVTQLGYTIVRSHRLEREASDLRMSLTQAVYDP